MTSTLRRVSAVLALGILVSPLAGAEGGTCPPGYYPIGGEAAGWTGCAPIADSTDDDASQSAGSYAAPAQTLWIAIATGENAFGVGKDQPSMRKAGSAALSDCKRKGGRKCALVYQTSDECVALAGGSNRTSVFAAATIAQSGAFAMTECNGYPGNGPCTLLYAGCSYSPGAR